MSATPTDTQVTLTRHAEQISSLQSGLKDLNTHLQELDSSFTKGMHELSRAVGEQVSKITERITNRNPMVYIGLGSLTLTIIITGAALTFFTITSQIKPIESHTEAVKVRAEKLEDRVQSMAESAIRTDEHVKMLEQRAAEDRATLYKKTTP